jgi:hypothetical protein
MLSAKASSVRSWQECTCDDSASPYSLLAYKGLYVNTWAFVYGGILYGVQAALFPFAQRGSD